MKKVNKYLLLTMMLGLLLPLLAACGSSSGLGGVGDAIYRGEEEDPYPRYARVTYIYSGSVADGTDPMVNIFELGRKETERTLGIETNYIENVLVQEFQDAVDIAIASGSNMIVAADSRFSGAAVLAARNNINTKFVSFGASDNSYNLASVQPLLYQAAYVNGFTAAFNTKSSKIGIVADPAMYNVYGIINAFSLGVRDLPNSRIDMYLNWARSANISDTQNAINDLVEQGCDIVLVYQLNDFGIRKCNELGLTVVGFAYNMPELAPDTYLTGMYLNLNTFLIDKSRGIMYDTFSGDLTRGGLKHQQVRLVMLNESLAVDGTKELTDAMMDYVSEDLAPVFGGEIRDTNDYVRVRNGEYMITDQIYRIDWLVNTIVRQQNFSTQYIEEDLVHSDLIVKS
ncbi:MAG: BMP family ABC transporter substrate-binding protein [Oscillospiraceae bacterium]|nr:BMP family ABC transporter substrate-binding protein [Oscillospiraceae bacterium]